jgi:hypothetical protein
MDHQSYLQNPRQLQEASINVSQLNSKNQANYPITKSYLGDLSQSYMNQINTSFAKH